MSNHTSSQNTLQASIVQDATLFLSQSDDFIQDLSESISHVLERQKIPMRFLRYKPCYAERRDSSHPHLSLTDDKCNACNVLLDSKWQSHPKNVKIAGQTFLGELQLEGSEQRKPVQYSYELSWECEMSAIEGGKDSLSSKRKVLSNGKVEWPQAMVQLGRIRWDTFPAPPPPTDQEIQTRSLAITQSQEVGGGPKSWRRELANKIVPVKTLSFENDDGEPLEGDFHWSDRLLVRLTIDETSSNWRSAAEKCAQMRGESESQILW